jgi:predicted MFS family arabinose efflux permease
MNDTSTLIDKSTLQAILHLSFATFASMTIQRLCDPMLPQLATEFAVERAYAAHVISYFAVTYGLMQIVFGPLGDRYGKYRILSLATLGCSLGCLGSALALTLPMLIACRVITATCTAAIIPLGLAWVGDTVPYSIRQATLARVGLGSTMGIVAGQLFGGLLTDTLGWRWAFALVGLLFLFVGSVLWANPNARLRGLSESELSGEGVQASPNFFNNAWRVFKLQRARRLLSCVLLEGALAFGAIAISATHVHDQHAIMVSWAGSLVALFGLGGVLYMKFAKGLIDRLSEGDMIKLGASIFALAYACIGFSPHWGFDIPAFILAGFGFFMLHNTLQVLATQLYPPLRGTCMALFAALLFGGQSLGVILCAFLSSKVGSSWVLLSCGVCFALMGFALSALTTEVSSSSLE